MNQLDEVARRAEDEEAQAGDDTAGGGARRRKAVTLGKLTSLAAREVGADEAQPPQRVQARTQCE